MKVIDGQVFLHFLIGLTTILVLSDEERETVSTSFELQKSRELCVHPNEKRIDVNRNSD